MNVAWNTCSPGLISWFSSVHVERVEGITLIHAMTMYLLGCNAASVFRHNTSTVEVRKYVPQKRWCLPTRLYDVMSRKITIRIFISVEVSYIIATASCHYTLFDNCSWDGVVKWTNRWNWAGLLYHKRGTVPARMCVQMRQTPLKCA
jgi:hypothetical protein